MNLLLLGSIIFIGVYLLPSVVSLRRTLMQRLGPRTYKGLLDTLSANRRGAVKLTQAYPRSKDGVTVAAGLLVYGVPLLLHPYLSGVAVLR
jgi:hypothetical protein